MPKGKHHGRELSPKEQEELFQVYAVTGNKRETARQLQLAEKTVYKYIKQAPPAQVKKARQTALVELAEETHDVALQIVRSIKPVDFDSGRIAIRDRDGNLTGYRYYGPTLLQKVTSVAILEDKLKVLEDVRHSLSESQSQGEMLTPSDARILMDGIQLKLKRLKIIDAQFENHNPDLAQRAQQALEEAEIVAAAKPADAEVIDTSRFDNPGRQSDG